VNIFNHICYDQMHNARIIGNNVSRYSGCYYIVTVPRNDKYNITVSGSIITGRSVFVYVGMTLNISNTPELRRRAFRNDTVTYDFSIVGYKRVYIGILSDDLNYDFQVDDFQIMNQAGERISDNLRVWNRLGAYIDYYNDDGSKIHGNIVSIPPVLDFGGNNLNKLATVNMDNVEIYGNAIAIGNVDIGNKHDNTVKIEYIDDVIARQKSDSSVSNDDNIIIDEPRDIDNVVQINNNNNNNNNNDNHINHFISVSWRNKHEIYRDLAVMIHELPDSIIYVNIPINDMINKYDITYDKLAYNNTYVESRSDYVFELSYVRKLLNQRNYKYIIDEFINNVAYNSNLAPIKHVNPNNPMILIICIIIDQSSDIAIRMIKRQEYQNVKYVILDKTYSNIVGSIPYISQDQIGNIIKSYNPDMYIIMSNIFILKDSQALYRIIAAYDANYGINVFECKHRHVKLDHAMGDNTNIEVVSYNSNNRNVKYHQINIFEYIGSEQTYLCDDNINGNPYIDIIHDNSNSIYITRYDKLMIDNASAIIYNKIEI